MSRRAVTLIVGIVLLAGLVAAAATAPVKYVKIEPGLTFNTLGSFQGKQLITITGAPTSTSAGQLRMLTISEEQGLSTFDVIRGWLNRDDAVVPREVLFPQGETQQQVDKQNADLFASSQNSATTVALRHEGYPVLVTISDVVAGKPADGHLQKGDIVTAVDGTPILSSMDLISDIQAKPVGTPLVISYKRAGKDGQTTITSVKGDSGKPQIGVSVDQKQPSPINVKFSLDNVGGPSAGLMFTLGIIDKLDPVDLTGGKIISGTGTMDDDGNVGPIGGIAQKEIAAYNAGARFFLAPADNCSEALKNHVRGLELIKVSTINDALTALQQIRAGQQPKLCGQ
jgi:Lon-like protease